MNFLRFFLSKCYYLFKLHNKKMVVGIRTIPYFSNQINKYYFTLYLCTYYVHAKKREFTFRCQLALTMTQKLTVIVLSFLILGIQSCTLFHNKFYQEFTDEGLSDDSNINVQRIRWEVIKLEIIPGSDYFIYWTLKNSHKRDIT